MSISGRARKGSLPVRQPLFYYITDRHQLPDPSIEALLLQVKRAAAWGADFIQLREKDLTGRMLFDLTRKAVELSRDTACRILVNGRIDVALAAGAHGVHLPAAGFRPIDVTSHRSRGFLLGVSAHSLREARQAAEGGADYLLLGPVFPTPSKMRYGKPMGLHSFARICSAIEVPVFGLGGIHAERIPSVLEAGAVGIAGIRFFQADLHRNSRDRFLAPMSR